MQKFYKKYQKGIDIPQGMVYIGIRINQQYNMTGGHHHDETRI